MSHVDPCTHSFPDPFPQPIDQPGNCRGCGISYQEAKDAAAMTTAADELRAASATLRKLATDATPGPWRRPLNTRYKATVTGPLPEGERGGWLDGNDPATGEREQCTVAMVPAWSNGRHSRQRGGRDLEYIAALHPGVGELLADWLDSAAVDAEQIGADHRALAVARQINTGSQP